MVVDIHVNDDSVEVANLWHVVSLYCSNGCKDKNNFAKLFAFAVKSNKTSREKSGKPRRYLRSRLPAFAFPTLLYLVGAML